MFDSVAIDVPRPLRCVVRTYWLLKNVLSMPSVCVHSCPFFSPAVHVCVLPVDQSPRMPLELRTGTRAFRPLEHCTDFKLAMKPCVMVGRCSLVRAALLSSAQSSRVEWKRPFACFHSPGPSAPLSIPDCARIRSLVRLVNQRVFLNFLA